METIAQDIMSTELITITEKSTIEEALKSLINHKITGLPVVDKKGAFVGIVSEYDLIAQLARHKALKPDVFKQPIDYSRKIEFISSKTPLSKIVELFVESKFRRLPVVDSKGKLVGIITRRDLMRLFYYRAHLT